MESNYLILTVSGAFDCRCAAIDGCRNHFWRKVDDDFECDRSNFSSQIIKSSLRDILLAFVTKLISVKTINGHGW